MANMYFADGATAAEFAPGHLLEVTGDEARHAVVVSRLRAGEHIFVGDGRGTVASGIVETAEKKRFAVRIESVRREKRPEQRLVLVQALAKGDRAERAVEQATEFGVDAVAPWESTHTVSRWRGKASGGDERVAKGIEKWRRIARESSKQSLRAYIPEIHPPLLIQELCKLAAGDDNVVVLHPRGERTLSSWSNTLSRQALSDTYIVIGPEGGLSDAEVDRLAEAGAEVLVLGSTVLRTSSAGPASIAVLNVALGRW